MPANPHPRHSSGDRTVHAAYPGMEIVRYNRAGKWYLEPTDGGKRRHVSITDAVLDALDHSAEVFFGRPGGTMFDAKARLYA